MVSTQRNTVLLTNYWTKINMFGKSLFRSLLMTQVNQRWHQTSLTTELIEHMDKKATWDRFYTEASQRKFKHFEWFFGFDRVRDVLLSLIQRPTDGNDNFNVLDMGCGTSGLGLSLYGCSPLPVQVTCVDISPVAVKLMQEHLKSAPIEPLNRQSSLSFQELDCTLLQEHFRPKTLDLIVDKGTTDALLRSKDGQAKAGQILRQCLAVLCRTGSLVQFSDEDPDARIPWLEKETLGTTGVAVDIGLQEIGVLQGVCYYCYQISPYKNLNRLE